MLVRRAVVGDIDAITHIYNQGIEDRTATLETSPKSAAEIRGWLDRDPRYAVLVAEAEGSIAGWASLNPYDHR